MKINFTKAIALPATSGARLAADQLDSRCEQGLAESVTMIRFRRLSVTMLACRRAVLAMIAVGLGNATLSFGAGETAKPFRSVAVTLAEDGGAYYEQVVRGAEHGARAVNPQIKFV